MEFNFLLKHLSDLNILEIGRQECPPGHSYSSAFPEHFLIHYVVSGKGILRTNNKEYTLGKGNAFFIGNNFSYYEADANDPWTYMWIHFSGDVAEKCIENMGVNNKHPIYKTKMPDEIEKSFRKLLISDSEKNEYFVYSHFFELFGKFAETNENKIPTSNTNEKHYIERCLEFVHTNYYKDITTADMCDCVGLEYSYLSRLFKKQMNTSPAKYLWDYRLSRGKYLIKNTTMPINDIAYSVGYKDRTSFSKAFSKKYGKSPYFYRENTFIKDETKE